MYASHLTAAHLTPWSMSPKWQQIENIHSVHTHIWVSDLTLHTRKREISLHWNQRWHSHSKWLQMTILVASREICRGALAEEAAEGARPLCAPEARSPARRRARIGSKAPSATRSCFYSARRQPARSLGARARAVGERDTESAVNAGREGVFAKVFCMSTAAYDLLYVTLWL